MRSGTSNAHLLEQEFIEKIVIDALPERAIIEQPVTLLVREPLHELSIADGLLVFEDAVD